MIQVTKMPLPNKCLPSFENGQLKTMTCIEGVGIRNWSILRLDDERKYDVELCWKLIVDLNSPGPERGLVLQKGYGKRHYVSFHYFVARDGRIIELVPPPIRSWSFGSTSYNEKEYCNNWMVGVAMLGDGKEPYTPEQYSALGSLCYEFMSAYGFDRDMIVKHSDIAIPPGRSNEPGSSFDMSALHEALDWKRMSEIDELEPEPALAAGTEA